MLSTLLSGNVDMRSFLIELLLSLPIIFLIISVHETAHGYVAYKLGDPTAKNLGRLTLNPIHHIDPFGALCMLFFHIGWAKPVPINPRNFKNPKRGFAITALAGPLSNLIMAFLFSGVFLLMYKVSVDVLVTDGEGFLFNLCQTTTLFFSIFYSVNIGLAIFNLIPIPPLDGSRILNVVLPQKAYFAIMKYERQIYLGLLAWLLLGDFVADAIRSVPLIASNPTLSLIAGIFSLSELLGYAITFIAGLFIKFWQLIPALRF